MGAPPVAARRKSPPSDETPLLDWCQTQKLIEALKCLLEEIRQLIENANEARSVDSEARKARQQANSGIAALITDASKLLWTTVLQATSAAQLRDALLAMIAHLKESA